MSERPAQPPPSAMPAELEGVVVDGDESDFYSLEVALETLVVPTSRALPVGSVATLTVRGRGGLPGMKAIGRVAEVLPPSTARNGQPALRFSLLDVRPGSVDRLDPSVRLPEVARVLVVDDDNLMRGEAEEAMRAAGHEVLSAKNGVEALSLALSEPIDLVLTDVTMPSMDGWQLLRLLRSRERLAKLPVIFLTRLTSDVERLKGYELGVSDYVDKPFQVEDLVARVAEQLNRRRRRVPLDAPKVLRGDMGQVALASLLSLAEMERRTGELRLERDDEKAVLYIRAGSVVNIDLDPRYEHKRGIDRLFHVLDWPEGTFELSAVAVDGPDELNVSTTHVLLSHAKLHDEAVAER